MNKQRFLNMKEEIQNILTDNEYTLCRNLEDTPDGYNCDEDAMTFLDSEELYNKGTLIFDMYEKLCWKDE